MLQATESEAPSWVIVQTKVMSEDIVERALRQYGYRVYIPRYRRLLLPRGSSRRPVSAMRPLFPRLVFCQDWHGWPETIIVGSTGLMQSRPGLARLTDVDVELIMGRERLGVFDDARHPYGDGKPHVRDDLIPGDEVDWEAFGRRVMGVLEELTPAGKAIVHACLFDRMVRTEVDADVLRKIVG